MHIATTSSSSPSSPSNSSKVHWSRTQQRLELPILSSTLRATICPVSPVALPVRHQLLLHPLPQLLSIIIQVVRRDLMVTCSLARVHLESPTIEEEKRKLLPLNLLIQNWDCSLTWDEEILNCSPAKVAVDSLTSTNLKTLLLSQNGNFKFL